MKKRLYLTLSFMFFLLMAIPSLHADAAATGIKITTSKKLVGYTKTLQLGVNVSGTDTGSVTWKSSDTGKATVNQNGLVTGTGGGSVKITASCDGKSDSITIFAVRYTPGDGESKKDVTIYYDGNKKRVYRNFERADYNGLYGSERGDAVTATATVLSGLVNFYITPDVVHQGTNHYSETYAIKKLGKAYAKQDTTSAAKRISSLHTSTPTNLMVNQILKNSGLKTKYVRTITSSSYDEVYQHLAKGYPVVFTTTKSKSYQGITMTGGTTTMVMLGLDSDGKALVMNPVSGRVNYSYKQKKSFHFSASEILKYYASSCKSATKFYSGDKGGYILVYPNASSVKITAMRLSRKNLKLDAGEKYNLDSYVNPATVDQTTEWSSSNESVLKVNSEGTITAVSAGTATVTATSIVDRSFSASCEVTVFAGKVNAVKVTATRKELTYGQKTKLKLEIDGGTKDDTIHWYSSNRNKATVDQNGTVTAQGTGYVEITAKVGAKSDSVTILTKRYSPMTLEGNIDVTIYYNGNTARTYKSYSQSAYNGSYGGHRGCAITSAAIVMSGMISPNITPATVHSGTSKYSETYAIKKRGSSYKKYDGIGASARLAKLNQSTPTNLMLQEILSNAGLKTKYVRKITAQSSTEVYEHLSKGNPVIFTTKSTNSYKGITLANTWHTLVMVGVDKDGNAIVINPAGGKVNYSHSTGKTFHFSVSEIIKNFERNNSSGTGFYSGGRYGYILVWK